MIFYFSGIGTDTKVFFQVVKKDWNLLYSYFDLEVSKLPFRTEIWDYIKQMKEGELDESK